MGAGARSSCPPLVALSQTAEGPVFLKTATDRLVYRGAMAVTGLSVALIVYGLARMYTGTGKIQRF